MEPFDWRTLTEALASAAIDPSRWPSALETVSLCTGSFGAVLLPVVGALPIVSGTASMDEISDRYVQEGWFARDERYLGTPKFLKLGVATDDDCMSADARRRSAFYQDFVAAQNLKDFAGVRVGRGDQVWNLSLQRSQKQDAFSHAELAALAQLSGTLDSVVQASTVLAQARAEAALDAFDSAGRAAVLLDRAGLVIRVNAAAESLVDDDFQISSGRIRSKNAKANETLSGAIKDLLWKETSFTSDPIVLPKESGGKRIVYPMRMPGLSASPFSSFHAILIVADTDAVNSPAVSTIKTVFGLTDAEARLAIAVAAGVDLNSFAADRGLSKETVRNQLKAIFLKTKTNRQTQLAVVLANFIPSK